MSNFEPTKEHLRGAPLFCFHLKHTAAESHRLLIEVYGEHAVSNPQCREWFRGFKKRDFGVQDKPRSGQPKNWLLL